MALKLSDFTAMSQFHELTDPAKLFLLQFSLEYNDREFYDSIQASVSLPSISIVDSFTHRYQSGSKQTDISARLKALTIESLRESRDDDLTALEKLFQRINKLCSLVLPRYNHADSKARFLKQAIIGTEGGFYAHARMPPHSTYQFTLAALQVTLREFSKHRAVSSFVPQTTTQSQFRQSLWKTHRLIVPSPDCSDALLAHSDAYPEHCGWSSAEPSETLYTHNQGPFATDPRHVMRRSLRKDHREHLVRHPQHQTPSSCGRSHYNRGSGSSLNACFKSELQDFSVRSSLSLKICTESHGA